MVPTGVANVAVLGRALIHVNGALGFLNPKLSKLWIAALRYDWPAILARAKKSADPGVSRSSIWVPW